MNRGPLHGMLDAGWVMRIPIYMDYHATTPVDPRALEAMLPYFSEKFGNAASKSHSFGWQAEEAVEAAREQVGRLIGASARELVCSSGATEAYNLAIRGAVTFLPVESDGRIAPARLQAALRPHTTLVSIMHANNETGVLHPVEEIGRITRSAGVLFHCDAVQSIGRIPFDVERIQADLVSLSAHKMYGPKGVGALYVRRKPRARILAQLDGGGHERGHGSGTAAALAAAEREGEAARLLALRERLRAGIWAGLDLLTLNGSLEHRLP